MAGATWNSIKISKDTYEKMKILSAGTGLSMDSIIREFLSYPDSIVNSEVNYLSSALEFYDFLKGARGYMQAQGWAKKQNREERDRKRKEEGAE